MTSLKKSITLRYIYLTLRPPGQNLSIRAPLSDYNIDIIQFINKIVFVYNTCTLNQVPLTGNVYSH